MAFYASGFQYDGIQSDIYNLYISDMSNSGESTTPGSSNVDIISEKIFRRQFPYQYGMTISDTLTFPIEITCPEEIDAESGAIIQRWLFSNRTFKKLLIFQPDMQNSYFNCVFNNPEVIRIGNVIQGYRADVVCDSAFAWEFPRTITYNYTVPIVNTIETFNNRSDDRGSYLYPNLLITINNIEDDMSITNLDDNNRVFSFTGLQANEVLTINNSLQTIVSSSGLKRLSNFNKNFLRLKPGINRLQIMGNILSIAMTTQYVAKKLG